MSQRPGDQLLLHGELDVTNESTSKAVLHFNEKGDVVAFIMRCRKNSSLAHSLSIDDRV